jgi:hypothetical protein
MAPPSTVTSNPNMPFSVTDILQPLAVTSSSSSSYSTQRSSSNPAFAPLSIHNNYYGSSATAFSPNNQYYDYSTSLQNGGNSTGQYSPSSCWYGSAASM